MPYRQNDNFVPCFILGVVSLRLLWHLLGPVGMAGDETYYWLWGQYPDWGYFSKPPLIGWLYGGLTAVFGQSVYLYKAFATLLGGGSLWFFYRVLGLLTGDEELARWGLVALALLPAHLLLSSMLTIDAPLVFCWAGGMFFTARLLISEKVSPGDFFGLWLMLSLGYLSKQMMLVQPLLIILMALFYKRELLRVLWFWLVLAGSLLALVPPLVWNAQNEWITVEHTAHHFEGSDLTLLKGLGRLGEFWGALAGLVSPVLFVFFFLALKYAWSHRREREVVYFFLFGGAAMIVMSLMAFRQRVNPNWPAVYLFGSLGLILLWGFSAEARKCLLKRGIAMAGGFSLLVMVFLLLLEPLAQPLAQWGLEPQRRGWQGYPQLVAEVTGLSNVPDQLVFVGHRFTASQFAFHGPDPRRVHLWNGAPETIRNQFDFFNPPELGKPLLVVVERKKASRTGEIPTRLAGLLEGVEILSEWPMHPVREYPRFRVYRAETLTGWPGLGSRS